uniref:Uncharacterized protein n=1 Tax=Meloidogyne javanica TaxID=6303 RepID=A0A915LQ13_MELJA
MVDHELKNSFDEFQDKKGRKGEKIDRLGFVYKLSEAYDVLNNQKREKGLKEILKKINELKLNSSGEKFETYKKIYEEYCGKIEEVEKVKVNFGNVCNIAKLGNKGKLEKLRKYIKKLEKEYNFEQILKAEEKCEELDNYLKKGGKLEEKKLEEFCKYFKQKREEILKV